MKANKQHSALEVIKKEPLKRRVFTVEFKAAIKGARLELNRVRMGKCPAAPASTSMEFPYTLFKSSLTPLAFA